MNDAAVTYATSLAHAKLIHVVRSHQQRLGYLTEFRCGECCFHVQILDGPEFPGRKLCQRCVPESQPTAEIQRRKTAAKRESLVGRVEWFTSDRYTAIAMRRWLLLNAEIFALPSNRAADDDHR